MMAIKGFDISRYEADCNYAAGKAAGMEFGYVCTWTGGGPDYRRVEHRDGIKGAGMEAGPYYVWDKANTTATGSPERMMQLADGFGLIPDLDFEKYYGEADLPSREFCWNWLGNFTTGLNSIYKGKKLFYTNLDGIDHLRPIPQWFIDNWLLHLALPNRTWTLDDIAPWPIVTLHQYALDVPGKSADGTIWASGIDLNGCNVPLDDIRRKDLTPPPVEVDPLEERIQKLEADVVSLAGSIGTVYTQQTTLVGRIDYLEHEIASICSSQAEHEKRIKALEEWAASAKPGYFNNLPFVVN